MLADLMTKGTKNKTPEQLENAIESLGATIRAYATDESIFISVTLAKITMLPWDLFKKYCYNRAGTLKNLI
jgi:predicted Zn-dependent peptidase